MSKYFQSAEQLYDVFEGFFNALRTHPTLAPRVLKLGNNLRFLIEDPVAEMTVDTKTPGGRVIMGPSDVACEIVMRMKADAGHRFWLGDLNLMLALTKREIVVERGALSSILQLLPVLKPAHAIYRETLRNKGWVCQPK